MSRYAPYFSPTYWLGFLLLLVVGWSVAVFANNPHYDVIARAWQGDAKAQMQLADRYRRGAGVAQNDFKAMQWYRDAANQGYTDAQVALARMYEQRDNSMPPDLERARFWYAKAAAKGNEFARSRLSVLTGYSALAAARQTRNAPPERKKPNKAWPSPASPPSFGGDFAIPADVVAPYPAAVRQEAYSPVRLSSDAAATQEQKATLAASLAEEPSFLAAHGVTMMLTLGLPFLLWVGLSWRNRH